MRALSFTSLAALALLAASCDSTPVEPPGADGSAANPLFKAEQGWVNGSFFADNGGYAECLGENIRFYGEVPYRWHRVFNSSGGYSDLVVFEPSRPGLPFLAEGQSSGIVWQARGATDPATYHAGPGEVVHAKINETYISRDGTNFKAYGGNHVTVNANGAVTAYREYSFDIECKGQG